MGKSLFDSVFKANLDLEGPASTFPRFALVGRIRACELISADFRIGQSLCCRLALPQSPLELGLIVERRLITFIVASSAFFFVYITLRSRFAVPPVNQDPVVAGVPADDPQGPIEPNAPVGKADDGGDGTTPPETSAAEMKRCLVEGEERSVVLLQLLVVA